MDISELTRRQARLLYTYAYNGGRPGPWLLGFLFGSTAKSEIEEDIRALNDGGWIVGFGVVRPDCYLEVVGHLLRSDRSFYAKLQRSNQFLYNSQEFLWNLCCLLSEKDYLRIRSIKRPDDLSINLADYFGHLAMTEEGDSLKDILSDKEKNAVITSARWSKVFSRRQDARDKLDPMVMSSGTETNYYFGGYLSRVEIEDGKVISETFEYSSVSDVDCLTAVYLKSGDDVYHLSYIFYHKDKRDVQIFGQQ